MFGLSLKRLSRFCLDLSTMLEAGLPLREALGSYLRVGRCPFGPLARRLRVRLDAGMSFHQALQEDGGTFPRMMLSVVRVGEETGALDAALRRLGEYYRMRREQRNRFLGRMLYPSFVLFMAILVLGVIAWATGKSPATVLLIGFGGGGFLAALYFVLTRGLAEVRVVQEVLMHVPLLGALRRYLATANFSWAMELMIRAGAPVREALRRAFEASDNGAFMGRAPRALAHIESGGSLTDALEATALFPHEYLQIVRVGQDSGTLDDAFGRLARQYYERTDFAARAWATGLAAVLYGAIMLFAAYIVISFWLSYYGRLMQAGSLQ